MTGYRDGYDARKWHAASLRQRRRRYWVRWGLAGSTVVALASGLLMRGDHPPFAVMLLPAYFLSISPFGRGDWMTRRGLAAYDEFEQTALLRATALAFATYIVLTALLFGMLAVSPETGWPIPTRPMEWVGWITALVATGVSLPATFAEFLIPMPDAEDEPL